MCSLGYGHGPEFPGALGTELEVTRCRLRWAQARRLGWGTHPAVAVVGEAFAHTLEHSSGLNGLTSAWCAEPP